MYAKLFSSITASTIWRAPNQTRILWITMLAMADKHGYVAASVPGLADIARLSLDETVKALEELASPDEWSGSQEYEGKRIEKVDGGWYLLNYGKYRDIKDEDERREYMREYMRQKRRAEKANNVNISSSVNSGKPKLAELTHQIISDHIKEESKSKHLARFSDREISKIYGEYPRKVGRGSAVKAIAKALCGLMDGDSPKEIFASSDDVVVWMMQRVQMFARSPAGQLGTYTPHPATWFNRKSYLDDEMEWNENGAHQQEPSKSQQRVNRTRTALVSALGAVASSGSGQPVVQPRTTRSGNPVLASGIKRIE